MHDLDGVDDASAEETGVERTNASFVPLAQSSGPDVEQPRHGYQRKGRFSCPECGKICARRDAVYRHRRVKHHIGIQYSCGEPNCNKKDKQWGRFDAFKKHMEAHHQKSIMYQDSDNFGRVVPPTPDDPSPSLIESESSRTAATPELPTSYSRDSDMPHTAYARGDEHKPTPSLATSTLPHLDSYDRGQLIQLIGAKMHECDELRRQCETLRTERDGKTRECGELKDQCHITKMERDEYLEALTISEELRKNLEAQGRS
ncbi:hypothetical protein GGR57DRAFT_183722 [Xylariaceae sp. FL1272]|nr:hypothetical protein GGR57DRAFT_183722 [Xylariaceae sp. FL1272]